MVEMERVQQWEGYLASKGEKLVPASQHGRGQAADLSSRLVHRDLEHNTFSPGGGHNMARL